MIKFWKLLAIIEKVITKIVYTTNFYNDSKHLIFAIIYSKILLFYKNKIKMSLLIIKF